MHVPSGPLSKYIENIVFFEGYTAEHKADKLLPDGGIYLIINMLEKTEKLFRNESLTTYQEFTGCFISGQHKRFIFIEAEHSSNMAIKFKLGGAAPFLDFPVSLLNNKVRQAEPIFGNKISVIRQKIIIEKDVQKKFSLMENFLLNSIRNGYSDNNKFLEVLEFLAAAPHAASIRELSERMGVTQKHMITLFNTQVGLTPKALARIFRFQKVILELEKLKPADWLQIALDCGYYDQAHFIKDFYAFSGIRPTAYSEQKGDYLNYLPVK